LLVLFVLSIFVFSLSNTRRYICLVLNAIFWGISSNANKPNENECVSRQCFTIISFYCRYLLIDKIYICLENLFIDKIYICKSYTYLLHLYFIDNLVNLSCRLELEKQVKVIPKSSLQKINRSNRLSIWA